MKTTATTAAVSSPPEENEHWSQQWRRNTAGAGQKSRADWKKDLHNLGAGRKSRKPPTPFVGMKPYGKCQYKSQPQCLQKDLSFLDSLALIGIHLDRWAGPVVFYTRRDGPNCHQKPPIFFTGGDDFFDQAAKTTSIFVFVGFRRL